MKLHHRILLLSLLLGTEYLCLTVLLDGQAISKTSLGYWFSKVHHLPAILLSVLSCWVLLNYERIPSWVGFLKKQFSSDEEPSSCFSQVTKVVWLQLLLFAGLLVLSHVLFRLGASHFARPTLFSLMVLWGVFLVLVGLASIAILVPLRIVARRLWVNGQSILIGIGLGLFVWRVGLWGAHFLWGSLGQLTMAASAFLLALFVSPVVYEPANAALGTEAFGVHVAPECSGLEGIGLMVVFLSVFLWVSRKHIRLPRGFLLIPLGVLLIWGLNVLRITSLILVGVWWSPKVALGGFHSKAGWVLFCAVALGLVYVTLRSAWFLKPNSTFVAKSLPQEEVWNPTAAYLLPMLTWIGVMLVAGMVQSTSFDRLYILRIPFTLVVLWWFRSYWRANHYSLSWEAIGAGFLVYLLWIVAFQEPPDSSANLWSQDFQQLSGMERDLWIFSRLLGSIFLIPVVEELAFRGFLLRRLISSDFTEVHLTSIHWFSFLLSSVAFGWMHQSWLAGTLAGLVFAWVYSRRGHLMDAVVAHAIANLLVAFHVMSTQSWLLWM